ncbi:MAG: DNA alkylation repair protein [Anaerosomatales bacterium]|nr:DNA alkylation repair protein [Anaerosomatales bacterium]
MDVDSVMRELEALGTERTKKSYLSRGVREPLFGVATGAMKPLKKQIGTDQALAARLWDTGNYDAMYLARMIADVRVMNEADFDRWIDDAYCAMLSDFVVAVRVSYQPLHADALKTAEDIGVIEMVRDHKVTTLGSAAEQIRTAAEKGRIGFKRRAVRC